MGITRSRIEKKKVSGGKVNICRKRRKHELGRQPANTKLVDATKKDSTSSFSVVRVRGGNQKVRGLRLNIGSFSWTSQAVAKKTRILEVMYNATSNELVRTKSLVKSCVVAIDATPFKQWFARQYGVDFDAAKNAKLKKAKEGAEIDESKKAKAKDDASKTTLDVNSASNALKRTWASRLKGKKMEEAIIKQLEKGRLLCRITSRPGQTGRADGIVLEGAELQFYSKKIDSK